MYLYGASGHAKVIIEILESGDIKVDGLFDDNPLIRELIGYHVRPYDPAHNQQIIISIGNNNIRRKIEKILNVEYGTAVHPRSEVSARSVIGEGTVVMAGVTINSGSRIGRHCIINTNASVDHDCELEDFVHISPNVSLCGNVKVGEGSHIGAGATVIPGIGIGKWCTIGAGSLINKNVEDYSVVVGVPGKVIKKRIPDE